MKKTNEHYTWENENWSGVIKQNDLPDSFGVDLVRSLNDLNQEMIKKDYKEGVVTLSKMGNFYGNTLKVILTRP